MGKQDINWKKIIITVLLVVAIVWIASIIITFGFGMHLPNILKLHLFMVLTYTIFPICEGILLYKYKLPKPVSFFFIFHLIVTLIAMPIGIVDIILKALSIN